MLIIQIIISLFSLFFRAQYVSSEDSRWMNLDLITLDAIYRISLQNKQFLFVIENNMCLMIIYFIFIGILIEKKNRTS